MSEKPIKCGLVMPISAIDGCDETHWEQVRAIIEESLVGTNIEVELVSDADDVGVIQKRIIQNLYDNDIVVCDVSCKNPNVMFELGMRLAFDKPAVIIKDDVTPYSFDTSPVEHIGYPRGLHYHQIQEFKKKLKSKILSTLESAKKADYTTFLKHFGKFVVAKLDEKKVGRDEYILEALQDLRKDVNRIRSDQNEYSILKKFLSSPPALPRKQARLLFNYPDQVSFINKYIRKNSLDNSQMKMLADPSSKLFVDLYESYLQLVSKDGYTVNNKYKEDIKNNLLTTLTEHLVNLESSINIG